MTVQVETEPSGAEVGDRRALEGEAALRFAVAPLTGVTVREADATGDGSWTIEGYAAVFEQETTLYNGRFWQLGEIIDRNAFGPVLARNPLVHLNHGHDMTKAVASTHVAGIGGLELEPDFHGLRYHARVDQDDPDARALAVKMRRGVIAQASFAFTVASEVLERAEETDDGKSVEVWRILEVRDLFDVCACAQGAYDGTESHLRGLASAYGRAAEFAAGRQGRPATDGTGGPRGVVADGEAHRGRHRQHVDAAKRRARARASAAAFNLTPRGTE